MTYDPNQPPPGYHPASQVHVHVAEKKPRKWPWITACVALVLCCGPCSYVIFKSGSHDGTGGSSSHEAARPAGLNSAVRDGKLEFVATAINPGPASISGTKAQGRHVVLSLTVKNPGDKAQWFGPLDQKLIDHEGRSFKADTAYKTEPGDWNLLGENVNPGNSIDVKIAYDLPKEAEPEAVELHDSAFSHGVKASLK